MLNAFAISQVKMPWAVLKGSFCGCLSPKRGVFQTTGFGGRDESGGKDRRETRPTRFERLKKLRTGMSCDLERQRWKE